MKREPKEEKSCSACRGDKCREDLDGEEPCKNWTPLLNIKLNNWQPKTDNSAIAGKELNYIIKAEVDTNTEGDEDRITLYIKDTDVSPEYIAYIRLKEFGLTKELATEICRRINNGKQM